MLDNATFMQHYWWFLISLLGALLVLLMFVQGGQSLLWQLGKTEDERRLLTNSTGRKWELTFTTLVTFGGAFFASFPLFYSTSFGGAYWVWILILLCFVIQAISYEFQGKMGNILGKRTYRIFLFLNGVLAPLLIGTAIGTFYHGAEFLVCKTQLTDIAAPTISRWGNPLHGLEATLNIWNLCLGLVLVFLSRTLARLYFINNITHENIVARAKRGLIWDALIFLICFLSFVGHLLSIDGFAINPQNQQIVIEAHKYANNLIQMPAVSTLLLLGVLGVLSGIALTLLSKSRAGIWFTGTGSVLSVLALLLCAGWNNTAFYPSLIDLQSSLTIANSSSSPYTLKVMSIVSLIIPFVLAYIFSVWRSMDKGGISLEETKNDSHGY